MTTSAPATIDAAAIRDRIATLTDRPVHVEQTGGGTATLYVGDYADDGRAWLAIGPGSYSWADPWRSTFTLSDLWVGPDGDDADAGAYVYTIDGLADAIRAACPECGWPDTAHLTRDQWAGDSRDGLGCAYTDGSRQHQRPATAADYLDALGDPKGWE